MEGLSTVWFQHLEDPEILRGLEANIAQVEEVNLLPEAGSLHHIMMNLTGKSTPLNQLIITSNPDIDEDNWVYDWFKLVQFSPDYSGDPIPIGKPCSCHFCQRCLNSGLGEFLYVDEKCPQCNSRKDTKCPGNQYYQRIIHMLPFNNPHLPTIFIQSMIGAMDETKAQIFIHGKVITLYQGKAYKSFKREEHVLEEEIELDPEKDVIWTLDFNMNPMCTVILQEHNKDGFEYAVALDEIYRWDADPTGIDVARMFVNWLKAREFKATIKIYGDPNGFHGGTKRQRTKYQVIHDILKDEGFNVRIEIKNVKPSLTESVDNTNAVLKNARGEIKCFVNKRCEKLIASLSGVKWKIKTKGDSPELDKQCDHNAFKAEDKEKVRFMTHPSDAFRYYVYFRFPILKDKKGVRVAVLSGDSMVAQVGSQILERDSNLKKQRGELRSIDGKVITLRSLLSSFGVDLPRLMNKI